MRQISRRQHSYAESSWYQQETVKKQMARNNGYNRYG
jgi:hypothetical protein